MLPRPQTRACPDAGFSLVEVMIATLLLATSLTALAQLFAISLTNNAIARNGTIASVLAAQKMEQLRSYPSLAASPGNTLQASTDGYVDHVDQYIRRWSIEPLPGSSAFLVQVRVTRRPNRGAADEGDVLRGPEEARVITVIRQAP
jgi:prepilin-type N-terminal cleavage/methylation domain-containing protein